MRLEPTAYRAEHAVRGPLRRSTAPDDGGAGSAAERHPGHGAAMGQDRKGPADSRDSGESVPVRPGRRPRTAWPAAEAARLAVHEPVTVDAIICNRTCVY